MSAANYEVIWKGKRSGPYTKEQLLAMFKRGDISLMHQVATPEGIISLRDLVEVAPRQRPPTRNLGTQSAPVVKTPGLPPPPPQKMNFANPTLSSSSGSNQELARPDGDAPLSHPPLVGERSGSSHHVHEFQKESVRVVPPPREEVRQQQDFSGSPDGGQLNLDDFRPLLMAEGWVRLFGIVTLIGGIFSLLGALAGAVVTFGIGSIGVLPAGISIWVGIILIECAAELRRVKSLGSADSLAGAVDRIALYFKILGIMALVAVIVVLIGVLFFGFAIFMGSGFLENTG